MSDKIFNKLLIHTCKIYRRDLDSGNLDKWGAADETFTTISSSEACLYQQSEELIEYSRRGEKLYTRLMVFFKETANILEDDIIEIDEKKFRVVGVDPLNDDKGIHHYEVAVINLENN